VRLLIATGLAAAILPEIVPSDAAGQAGLDRALAALDRLDEPGFPLALAALLGELIGPEAVVAVGRRWRLANKEIERAAGLVENRQALVAARQLRWSRLQPLLTAEGVEDLLVLTAAVAPASVEEVAFCRAALARPPAELDPPPLVTGDDLLAQGVPSGPRYAQLLRQLRAAQLDGQIYAKQDALALLDRLLAASENEGS
jgi:hypothetical protein